VAIPSVARPVPNPRGPNHHVLKEFDDDDKGGGRYKHKGNDRDHDYSGPVTSPLPTLPGVQVSTMTTWGPGHLRGVNNRDILKDAFDDDDKGGGRHKHKGNDRDQDYSGLVTSPLPTLPAIQVPTITTLAPGQSGGNNSRDLLREILDDDNRGGGRKGRDRDKDD
jgi:hypothetical protein